MAAKYTDISFLRENTFNNTKTMRDLIQIYLDTTPEMIARLNEVAQNYDVNEIKTAAHKLRSSFSTMGVVTADELLSEIENSTNKMGKDGVLAALKKLDVIANEVDKELNSAIKEL